MLVISVLMGFMLASSKLEGSMPGGFMSVMYMLDFSLLVNFMLYAQS
jgi:hypothetical protein